MTSTQFIKSYWDYYIELEEQFASTQKYVAFSEVNNKTFSVEYLKLIQAVCSEIDVVAKEIATFFKADFANETNPNIQKWGFIIQHSLPNIVNAQVTFCDEIVIRPWENFGYDDYFDKNGVYRYKLAKGCETPTWWSDYNKIKHHRTSKNKNGYENFTLANLHNMIMCYGALYVLEMSFIEFLEENDGTNYAIFESDLFSFSMPYTDKKDVAVR